MNIEEALAAAEEKQKGAAASHVVEVAYISRGDFDIGFPRAVRVSINGEPEMVFDVPDQIGTHTKRFDISASVRRGEKNVLKIQVDVYDFEFAIGRVKSTASVRVRAGWATLFAEDYGSNLTWRRSQEELAFYA